MIGIQVIGAQAVDVVSPETQGYTIAIPSGGVPAGATIVVAQVNLPGDGSLFSHWLISDTAGNTYHQGAGVESGTTLQDVVTSFVYAYNALPLVAGDTITVTSSGGTGDYIAYSAFYLTGTTTSDPYQAAITGTDSAGTPHSPDATLQGAPAPGSVVIGIIGRSDASFTQDPAYATTPAGAGLSNSDNIFCGARFADTAVSWQPALAGGSTTAFAELLTAWKTAQPPLAVPPALPALQGWEMTKRPGFSARTQRAVSGRELRALDRALPVWEWTLTMPALRDDNDSRGAGLGAGYDELRTIADFILDEAGANSIFAFDDPTDDSVTGQALFTGDGVTESFQARRTIGGASGFTEPLFLLTGVGALYYDGVAVTPTTATAWDGATGVIAALVPAGVGVAVTADFTYRFAVRFADDSADLRNLLLDLWEFKEVRLRSVLPGSYAAGAPALTLNWP